MNVLEELQHWYQLHCDNDWEHSYGISIETLDNPGWKISVDLTDTLLENVEFQSIQIGNPESKTESWMFCRKDKSCFIGMGGCYDLENIISIFLKWSKRNTNTSSWDHVVSNLIKACNSCNNIEEMRQIYNEIDSIPNEHEQKKKLLNIFNSKWNEIMKNL